MASLDRAYGARGALLALGMACVAGGVHGVLANQFDYLAVKIVIGIAGAIVLIMAGAISARQSMASAVVTGLLMGLLFFVCRWVGWSLMEGGINGAVAFLATPPWSWPTFLALAGISGYWTVEAISMLIPALIGCVVGQERPE